MISCVLYDLMTCIVPSHTAFLLYLSSVELTVDNFFHHHVLGGVWLSVCLISMSSWWMSNASTLRRSKISRTSVPRMSGCPPNWSKWVISREFLCVFYFSIHSIEFIWLHFYPLYTTMGLTFHALYIGIPYGIYCAYFSHTFIDHMMLLRVK